MGIFSLSSSSDSLRGLHPHLISILPAGWFYFVPLQLGPPSLQEDLSAIKCDSIWLSRSSKHHHPTHLSISDSQKRTHGGPARVRCQLLEPLAVGNRKRTHGTRSYSCSSQEPGEGQLPRKRHASVGSIFYLVVVVVGGLCICVTFFREEHTPNVRLS